MSGPDHRHHSSITSSLADDILCRGARADALYPVYMLRSYQVLELWSWTPTFTIASFRYASCVLPEILYKPVVKV
jgi:hypothetical protein